MRSPLTETFKRVTGMIDHVRENLDEEEYDLFLDLIVPPEPQAEKPKPRKPKKILHCDACNYTKRHQVHKDSSRSDYHEFQSAKGSSKSRRARGMAAAIGESLQRGKEAKVDSNDSDDNGDNDSRCQFIRSDDKICNLLADHNVHHLKASMDYHEFVEGVEEESAQAASGD